MKKTIHFFASALVITLLSGCGKKHPSRAHSSIHKNHRFYASQKNKYWEEIDLIHAGQNNDLINCIADKNKAVRWYTYLFGDPELSRNTPLHKGHSRISRDIYKLGKHIKKVKKQNSTFAKGLTCRLEDLKEDLILIKQTISRHPEFRQESRFTTSYHAMKDLEYTVSSLKAELTDQKKEREENEDITTTNF